MKEFKFYSLPAARSFASQVGGVYYFSHPFWKVRFNPENMNGPAIAVSKEQT